MTHPFFFGKEIVDTFSEEKVFYIFVIVREK